MDRFTLLQRIIERSDLDSMRSLLVQTCDALNAALTTQVAAYFNAGPGRPRCLAARTSPGSDLSRPEQQLPVEFCERVAAAKKPMMMQMPRLQSGGTVATGSARIVRMMALPMLEKEETLGVFYLERGIQQPNFQKDEIAALQEVLQVVQFLLNRSHDFERQSYELDDIKSRMAMRQVQLISEHAGMLKLFRFIQKLAKVPSTVLIHGESGTGKELVARAIYELGTYKGPFISMNCGGIEASLLKSELFGYVKGSFTGAQKDRAGLFKRADGGVLFMDEIGEMPMDMQVSLLRTLESGEIQPVGADAPDMVKTRVVAATHRNLKDMVKEGTFRNDLYQRLKGITLEVPPLRDRRSDIPLLSRHFIQKYNERLGVSFKGLRPEAEARLTAMSFEQGNVRELERILERAMVFEDDEDYIGVDHLTVDDEETTSTAGSATCFEDRMNHHAVAILTEAIKGCGGNKTKAMKKLGLSRSTFYGMLKRYGLAEDMVVSP